MEQTTTQQIKLETTLGRSRVHLNFNPSQDDEVGNYKLIVSQLIDFCNQKLNQSQDSETKRCFSLAMTELETACMYGVKGLTKNK